jgi:low temperature requirement protein LtrA
VSDQHVERDQRVTPLELFLDLVFVFAFTQVTTVLSDNPSWSGLLHALLLLGALWWAWAAYAWLTNTLDPDEERVWAAMLVAMAAMFIAALAVPEAFGRHGVVFGVAFMIVVVMQLTLYALSNHGDRDLRNAVIRIAPSAIAGAALVIAAQTRSSSGSRVFVNQAYEAHAHQSAASSRRAWRSPLQLGLSREPLSPG